jgi:putative SOS response-associated peptidase YedK
MCARFTLTTPVDRVQRLFNFPLPSFEPRFNIAPTQSVLAVLQDREGLHCDMLRWGLIPSWSKDPSIGQRLINARSETIMEKPAFRNAFQRRRCLIPASGFYEWLHPDVADSLMDDIGREGPSLTDRAQGGLFEELEEAPKPANAGKRQPFYFTLTDNEPFAFGGLWESWQDAAGNPLRTCTILTTQPNEIVGKLHDRMPVMLRTEDFDSWLDPEVTSAAELMPLLTPYPADEMRMYPVSTDVNNPRHEGPECVLPL